MTHTKTFKERHPELQHLVRELLVVRKNNLRFQEGDPKSDSCDPPDTSPERGQADERPRMPPPAQEATEGPPGRSLRGRRQGWSRSRSPHPTRGNGK